MFRCRIFLQLSSKNALPRGRLPSPSQAMAVEDAHGMPVVTDNDELAVVAVGIGVGEIRAAGRQPSHLNSTALKTLRDSNESPPGWPVNQEGVIIYDFHQGIDQDPLMIKTLQRSTGVAYSLGDPEQPWSWRKFLNQMQDDTLKHVIGTGVVSVSCAPITGSYDWKRQQAAKNLLGKGVSCAALTFAEEAPVPIWDFLCTRSDGTTLRIHPNQTNTKLSIENYHKPLPEPVAKGGRGTYQRVLAATYTGEGRLIHDKSTTAYPGRGGGDSGGLRTRGSASAASGSWESTAWWDAKAWEEGRGSWKESSGSNSRGKEEGSAMAEGRDAAQWGEARGKSWESSSSWNSRT